MKTIYTIPAPDSLGAMIEVYGEPENAWYEWRIIDGGRTVRDTGTEGHSAFQGRQYGQAEIALRDALMFASGLPIDGDTPTDAASLEAGYAANVEFHYLHHRPDGGVYDELAEMSARIAAAAQTTGIGLTLLPVAYQFGGLDQRPLGPGQRRFGNDPDRYARLIDARAARQPVAQIVGRRAFWKHDFRVTRDTLDPRPETETLIEAALAEPFASVLDLGTGTGAILISLLAERPGTRGIGTDISPAALIVARENVQQALQLLHAAGEPALEIGRIEARIDGEAQTLVV